MRWVSQSKMIPGFLLALFFFLAISIYSYRVSTHFAESTYWVDHTYQVLLGLENISSSLKDMERNTRSYLLTGEEEYLENYNGILEKLNSKLKEIRELTKDNPHQQNKIQILEPLVTKRMAYSKELTELYRSHRFTSESSAPLIRESKIVMDSIQELIFQMEQREKFLLNERIQKEKAVTQNMKWLIVIGNASGLLIMIFTLGFLFRGIARQRKIEEKHAQLATIVEFSEDAIIGKNLEGTILTWNKGAEKVYGYRADEVVSKSISLLIPPDLQNEFHLILEKLKRGESIRAYETWRVRKDGKKIPVSLVVSPIQNDQGVVIGASSIARDLSELKQTVLERDRFFNLSLDLFCIADLDGYFKRVNATFEKVLGYSSEEMLAKEFYEFIHPDDREKTHQEVQKLSEGSNTIGFENRFRCKDGSYRWISWSAPAPKEGETNLYAVGRDITDRKKIDQMKNEFISTVSHELRTPLTSIRGSLGLIVGKMGTELPPQVKPLVDIALNNCERLGRLINDILDIEKIESGKMEFRLAPVLIEPLIRNSLETNKAYGAQYNVQFELENDVPEAMVNIDPDKWMQVMSNLLSNAAKFSPKGAKVKVRVFQKESFIRVEVVDEGPGIPQAFRSHLFEKFSQADSSDSRQKGGTGLGLNISKTIVERMKGKIGFETSEKGTTFYFDLPLWHGLAPQYAETSKAKMKVLICEDEPDIARLLSLMLELEGYSADIAYTAKHALEMLQNQTYDAMTLDICLPDEDGITLIYKIREIPKTRELPIIVVSVKAEITRQKLRGTALNVVDWINKPIAPIRLKEAIQKVGECKKHSTPRILHVEDDLDTTRWVQTLLEDIASVSAAYNFREAEEKIKQELFDLVLLDVLLPDGNGAELLPLIKRRYGESSPVVVLSSNEWGPEIRKRVSAVLVKSLLTHNDLLKVIQDTLNRRT